MKLRLVANEQDVLRFACDGEITQLGLEPGKDPLEALLPGGDYCRKALLDLEKSTFIDSSGIGWLIVCQKRFVQAKGRMVIYNVPPLVMQVLQLLKMPLILSIATNETAARKLAE